jgi:Fic family protein
MFRRWRLRKVHEKFLESSRNLKEGRAYWAQAGGATRWFLQLIAPAPLLGLDTEGNVLLTALRWLEDHCRTHPLSEASIREYHRMINGTSVAHAGQYRTAELKVEDSTIPRPVADKVRPLMKQLDVKLAQEQERWDAAATKDLDTIFKWSVAVHQRIAFIHPFDDGNGRVARIAMNHLLRRYGLGYVILPNLNVSRTHFDTLEEAHRGNLDPLVAFSKEHLHPV